ncbi:MAG TPA: response regulator transcription factor [Chloroflexi bacterium]|nr:MAG: DNA-binding response regulator [Chloroflexota bacterium]HDD54933.1 response regulator transcription factor [Chloroflexota bacterium]
MVKKILVVDDNPDIVNMLKAYLSGEGFQVVTASNGQKALHVARSEKPDCIVLDMMMPKMRGDEFIRVYSAESDTPILVLTAKVDETDKVLGLELGADDYVTKPFSPRELSARIKALIRRSVKSQTESEIYRSADITLDKLGHLVEIAGQPVDLTPSEFDLLAVLISTPGRTYSRTELLESLGESTYLESFDRTVDVHIHNLREKIEPDPANPIYIQTVYGTGYRFARERK